MLVLFKKQRNRKAEWSGPFWKADGRDLSGKPMVGNLSGKPNVEGGIQTLYIIIKLIILLNIIMLIYDYYLVIIYELIIYQLMNGLIF